MFTKLRCLLFSAASLAGPSGSSDGTSKTLTAEAKADLRRRLLGPFRDRIRFIVFTKHFDIGGSHYAYTETVSDEDTLALDRFWLFSPGITP